MRTIIAVAVAALSTAALAQVGTDPVENKIPAAQQSAPATPPIASPSSDTAPATDDAPPSARADAPATAAPTVPARSADPTGVSAAPPKR